MTVTEYILIFIILVILTFYNRKEVFNFANKYYKNWKYPIKNFKIKSDLTKVHQMKKDIDEKLIGYLKNIGMNDKLYEITLESLKDGKRLRPIISLSIYKKLAGITNFSDIPNYVINISNAVEIIHTTSLVLDDIMDNDVERRGNKCIYIKYGETYALLISLYLITLVWQIFMHSLKESDMSSDLSIYVLNLFTEKLNQLSIGQFLDIEFPKTISDIGDNLKKSFMDNKINIQLEDMIHKKTSTLFELSFVLPFIIFNKNKNINYIKNSVDLITDIARKFGLIYQIADDFEDVERDMKRDGKNSIMNYVINNGPDKGKEYFEKLVDEFEKGAEDLNIYGDELKEIIEYLNQKVKVYYKNKFKRNK